MKINKIKKKNIKSIVINQIMKEINIKLIKLKRDY
jgi:hypothetical protein